MRSSHLILVLRNLFGQRDGLSQGRLRLLQPVCVGIHLAKVSQRLWILRLELRSALQFPLGFRFAMLLHGDVTEHVMAAEVVRIVFQFRLEFRNRFHETAFAVAIQIRHAHQQVNGARFWIFHQRFFELGQSLVEVFTFAISARVHNPQAGAIA